MAAQEHVQIVEKTIGYSFRSTTLLLQALTAAGAEAHNYDGNRRLAQVGTSLIDFLVVYIGYEGKNTRSEATMVKRGYVHI
jgi:dsRNA-specific ribonuclease